MMTRAPPSLLIRPQELQAIELRHAHVAQDDVERLLGSPLEGAPSIALGGNLEPRVGE